MGLGDFISGAFGFLGGVSNRNETRRTNRENLAHQNVWNQKSLDFANKQFTQGIQTRVADAKKAGLHPLYALGSPGAGSPSFTVGGASSSGALGQGIANAGAALGRAATRDPLGRELQQAQLANVNAQTAKTNAEALYWTAKAREPVNGGGLGVEGVRGQRAGQVAAERAAILGAIGRSGTRQGRRPLARGTASAAKRAARPGQLTARNTPDVVRSSVGPIAISGARPTVDEAEKYIGDWADWAVGLPNFFNIYGNAYKNHLKRIFGDGYKDMVTDKVERQKYLRFMRRRGRAR